jgi:hypothetical protein
LLPRDPRSAAGCLCPKGPRSLHTGTKVGKESVGPASQGLDTVKGSMLAVGFIWTTLKHPFTQGLTVLTATSKVPNTSPTEAVLSYPQAPLGPQRSSLQGSLNDDCCVLQQP